MSSRIARVGLSTAVSAGLVAGVGVFGATVPAQAKTIKVCVKKKTGEVKVLTTKKKQKKKCKKGWKKVSWNQTGSTGPQGPNGPTGPTGAQGPTQMVKDGTGATLGKYIGLYPAGFSILFVQIDGGAYTYLPNGQVYPLSGSPSFKTNTCTGIGYITSTSPQTTQLYVDSAGGPTRIVYRRTSPTLGPTVAFAFTRTTENVNQQLYKWDSAGTCIADGGVYNGTLVAMQPVTAPPDVPGPLTID